MDSTTASTARGAPRSVGIGQGALIVLPGGLESEQFGCLVLKVPGAGVWIEGGTGMQHPVVVEHLTVARRHLEDVSEIGITQNSTKCLPSGVEGLNQF